MALSMTVELHILLTSAVLTGSAWIPYIVGVNTTAYGGEEDTFVRPPDQALMEAWVHRAHRAQANLVEQFAPFAVIVLMAAMLGVSNVWTMGCAVAFLALRLLHAWGMIAGWARHPTRPAIFTAGWAVVVIYALAVWANAPTA